MPRQFKAHSKTKAQRDAHLRRSRPEVHCRLRGGDVQRSSRAVEGHAALARLPDRRKRESGIPRVPPPFTADEAAAAVAASKARVAESLSQGLITFQLKPKAADGSLKFTGKALFEHMVTFTRRTVSRETALRPSAYINVEMTPTQASLLDPSPQVRALISMILILMFIAKKLTFMLFSILYLRIIRPTRS